MPTNALPDLTRLPFPVAFPLFWAHDPSGGLGVAERRANAIFSCYQAMRLSALLMLADYLDVEDTDPDVSRRIRGLRIPHWQEWSFLADELARFWSADGRRPRFPRVVAGWLSVARVKRSKNAKTPQLDPKWQKLIEGFHGNGGKAQAGNANEAVWELRNQRAHREGVFTPEIDREQSEELDRLIPLVDAVVTSLFGSSEFELLRSVTVDDGKLKIIRLCGPHADLKFAAEEVEAEWIDALKPTAVAARFSEEAIPVYPLLVPTDEGNSRLLDQAVMIDGVTDGKLTVMGVQWGATLKGPHLQATLAALRRKQADLFVDRRSASLWTLAPWARTTAAQTLDDLTGTKYFPAFYLVRPDVDGALERYETQSGRALLLLGEAGSGKSSLIARLADRLVGSRDDGEQPAATTVSLVAEGAEQGEDLVAYLTGRADYGGTAAASADRLLVESVARKLGIREGEFGSLTDLVLHLEQESRSDTVGERRFWLLLDGLNEADRFVDLVRALDAFLPVLGQAPRLRVVASMRSGAFHSLSARDATLGAHSCPVFANADRFLGFPDARGHEQPWLEIRPFRLHDEGPRAYALRREKLPGNAADVPYDLLSPALKQLLLIPLYLHLFHETFAGRDDAPGDLDEGQLLDAYLDRFADSSSDAIAGARGWLDRLADTMLRQRRAFLPVAEAQEWADEWRRGIGFSSLQAVTKLDPVEELVAASVLLRPAETGSGFNRELAGYQFAQQKLAERVLLRHLDRKLASAGRSLPSRADLARWNTAAAAEPPFAELGGALAEWVARLTRSNAADAPARLDALLEIENDEVRKRLMGALIAASAAAAPDAAAAILHHLARTAAGRPDGRARFLLTAWDAVARLDDRAPLAARLRARRSLLAFGDSLHAGDPGNLEYQRDLSVSYDRVGDVQVAQGELSGALKSYRDSLAIAERLAQSDPGNAGWQRDLSVSYEKVGDVQVAQGELSGALKSYRDSLAIRERLAQSDPGNAGWQRDLGVSYAKLASVHLKCGDRAAGTMELRQGREIMDRLVRRAPDFAQWKRDLAWFDNQIDEADSAAEE
jgi:tetratricopeptide (TPR) repeat protein